MDIEAVETNGKGTEALDPKDEYLVIPRSILKAMPEEWQHDLIIMLDRLDRAFDWKPKEGRYSVSLRSKLGHGTPDPLRKYKSAETLEHVKSLRRK